MNRMVGGAGVSTRIASSHTANVGTYNRQLGEFTQSAATVVVYGIFTGLIGGASAQDTNLQRFGRPLAVNAATGVVISLAFNVAAHWTIHSANGVRSASELPLAGGMRTAPNGIYLNNLAAYRDVKTNRLKAQEVGINYGTTLAGGLALYGARALIPSSGGPQGTLAGARAGGGLFAFTVASHVARALLTYFTFDPNKRGVEFAVEGNKLTVERLRATTLDGFIGALDGSISQREARLEAGESHPSDDVYRNAMMAMDPSTYSPSPEIDRSCFARLVGYLGTVQAELHMVVAERKALPREGGALTADLTHLGEVVGALKQMLGTAEEDMRLGLADGQIKGISDRICEIAGILLEGMIHVGPPSQRGEAERMEDVTTEAAEQFAVSPFTRFAAQLEPFLDAFRMQDRQRAAGEFLVVLKAFHEGQNAGERPVTRQAAALRFNSGLMSRDVATMLHASASHEMDLPSYREAIDRLLGTETGLSARQTSRLPVREAVAQLLGDADELTPKQMYKLTILAGMLRSLDAGHPEGPPNGSAAAAVAIDRFMPQPGERQNFDDAKARFLDQLKNGDFGPGQVLATFAERRLPPTPQDIEVGQRAVPQDRDAAITNLTKALPGLEAVLRDEALDPVQSPMERVGELAGQMVLAGLYADFGKAPDTVKLHMGAALAQARSIDASDATKFFKVRNDGHHHTTGYAGSQNSLEVLVRYLDATRTEHAVVMAVPHEVNDKTAAAQYYLVLNEPLRRRDHDSAVGNRYRALSAEHKERIIPAMTGVPPKNESALVNYIESTLRDYPEFRAIGEVSPWKEFVGPQTGEGGPKDAFNDPAFRKLLQTSADVGRPLVLHFDRSLQLNKDVLIGPVLTVIRNVARTLRDFPAGSHEGFKQFRRDDAPPPAVFKVVHAHAGGISRSANPSSTFVHDTCEVLKDDALKGVYYLDLSWLPTDQFIWRSMGDLFNRKASERSGSVKEFCKRMSEHIDTMSKTYTSFKREIDQADKANDIGQKMLAGLKRNAGENVARSWLGARNSFKVMLKRELRTESVRRFVREICEEEGGKEDNNIFHMLFQYSDRFLGGTDSLHLQSIHSGDIDNITASQRLRFVEDLFDAMAEADIPSPAQRRFREAGENLRTGTFNRVFQDPDMRARADAFDGYLATARSSHLSGAVNPYNPAALRLWNSPGAGGTSTALDPSGAGPVATPRRGYQSYAPQRRPDAGEGSSTQRRQITQFGGAGSDDEVSDSDKRIGA